LNIDRVPNSYPGVARRPTCSDTSQRARYGPDSFAGSVLAPQTTMPTRDPAGG